MEMFEAVTLYQDKFNDSPPVFAVPEGLQDKAADLIAQAVQDDDPFADDAAFYEAIGMEAPPADAVT